MPVLRDSLLYTDSIDPHTKKPNIYLPHTLELCCAYNGAQFVQHCLLNEAAVSRDYPPEVLKFLVDRSPNKISLVKKVLDMASPDSSDYYSRCTSVIEHPRRVFQCFTQEEREEVLRTRKLSDDDKRLLQSLALTNS